MKDKSAAEARAEFLVSQEPLVHGDAAGPETGQPVGIDADDLGELPRSYGVPLIVAVARDPETLFVYWDIDWPVVFAGSEPTDRKVHLRVLDEAGGEKVITAVEPLAGSAFIKVPAANHSYQVELGYFQEREWFVVATSPRVITPAASVGERGEAEFASIPYHLSFERMVEMFASRQLEGEAPVETIARLEKEAAAEVPRADTPSANDRNTLAALECDFAELRRVYAAQDSSAPGWSREQLEQALGVGGSSPVSGLNAGSSSSRRV